MDPKRIQDRARVLEVGFALFQKLNAAMLEAAAALEGSTDPNTAKLGWALKTAVEAKGDMGRVSDQLGEEVAFEDIIEVALTTLWRSANLEHHRIADKANEALDAYGDHLDAQATFKH